MSRQGSPRASSHDEPPSTPRQHASRQDSAPGSILKTIFSPANWFGRKSSSQEEEQEPEDELSGSESDSTGDDADFSRITNDGVYADQVQKANTPKIYPSLPSTPLGHQSQSKAESPNAVLADFFTSKGNAPLTEIELEGVKALLARQSSESARPQEHQAPSYATPARKPYQPIFTPARMTTASGAATEMRKIRRTGYTPSTSASSPFKPRPAVRTSFYSNRVPHPSQPSTPAKYELKSTIAGSDVQPANGKRTLEEVAAPAAKRSRYENLGESGQADAAINKTAATGSKTAASILEILDSTTTVGDDDQAASTTKSPEQLKPMLNPYSRAGTPRKTVSSPRRTPAKKTTRSAIEEIARNDAIERKVPYQPKVSSGLTNSFTADDDTSLFSPKRRISPVKSDAEAEHNKHGGFTFTRDAEAAAKDTPTKQSSLVTEKASAPIPSMFGSVSGKSAHSTTPSFSFTASQMSGKTTEEATDANRNSSNESSGIATTAPAFSFTSTVKDDSTSTNPISFNFGQVSTQANKTNKGFGLRAEDTAGDHSAAGGFEVRSEQAETSSFGLGSHNDDKAEHKAHGGFVFGSPGTVQDDKDSADLIHQLRDGTEYVSPSKSTKSKSMDNETTASSSTSGFVFNPTTTKTSSSFSFAGYTAPTTSAETTGGFSFDANKKVDIIGKTIGNTKESDSTPKNDTQNVTKRPEDARQKVAAMPSSALSSFDFTSVPKGATGDKQTKAMSAELLVFEFTTSVPQTIQPSVATGGFNWAAAGLRKPEVGWECDVCMVSNKADAKQCVSCETERPTAKVQSSSTVSAPAAAPSSKAAASTGFNWAAAGMQKPTEQWTCSVCMVGNPMSAKACLSCETEK